MIADDSHGDDISNVIQESTPMVGGHHQPAIPMFSGLCAVVSINSSVVPELLIWNQSLVLMNVLDGCICSLGNQSTNHLNTI